MGTARGQRGQSCPRPPSHCRGRGKGAQTELWMGVFNYTIKCTIRYNYQCSEGATVHNRHVIYCSHCLYCSAPLANDYGKLSHLHGCHGNGGLTEASGMASPSSPRTPSPRDGTQWVRRCLRPWGCCRVVGAGVERWGCSGDGQRRGARDRPKVGTACVRGMKNPSPPCHLPG